MFKLRNKFSIRRNASKRWRAAVNANQPEPVKPDLQAQKTIISEPLSVHIRGTNLSVDEQKQCVEIANIALDTQGIENEIATAIKTKLDDITHDTWHVIVGRNFGTHISFTKYIHFAAAKITILIFQC
uniref:Dynein light chain n=1 Tax=Panagrellus redivivus TaxID=6233 RepID=A0A7E4W8D9_PANRE